MSFFLSIVAMMVISFKTFSKVYHCKKTIFSSFRGVEVSPMELHFYSKTLNFIPKVWIARLFSELSAALQHFFTWECFSLFVSVPSASSNKPEELLYIALVFDSGWILCANGHTELSVLSLKSDISFNGNEIHSVEERKSLFSEKSKVHKPNVGKQSKTIKWPGKRVMHLQTSLAKNYQQKQLQYRRTTTRVATGQVRRITVVQVILTQLTLLYQLVSY